MNLQLFAEGDSGDGEGESGADDAPKGGDSEAAGLGGEPEKKYTYTDIDKMLARRFAEWEKDKEKEQKKKDEAKRLQDMNAQEKAEYENRQLKERLDELLRKDELSKMSRTARGMLSDKGINVSDALLEMMVSEEADKTKEAVNSFIIAFQEAVKKAVTDALKGETPKTGSPSGITKEQIMAIKNRAERQRLIRENMNLFK